MITAAQILALLLALMPAPASEHPRYQTIAEATATAHAALLPRWTLSPRSLLAAQITGMRFNGALSREVHDGTLRGPGGDSCLMDINPGNPLRLNYAATMDELVGVDYESTLHCLMTGTETLVVSARYCLAKRYRRNVVPAMWSLFATGNRCWLHKQARERAAYMARVEWEIGRLEQWDK